MLRDGDDCAVTGFCFFPPSFVPSRCAHLIPFSIHSKVVLYHLLDDAYPYLSIQTQTFSAIESFTGFALDTEATQIYLNHPGNALNLEIGAHEIMDKNLAWGIEAIYSNDQVLFFRFACVLVFTYHIVELLLPNCSTGSEVRHYTAKRWR